MGKAKEYICKYTRNDSNMVSGFTDKGEPVVDYYSWIHPDDALRAVEISRKELLENAIKWLRKELVNFEDYNGMGEELYRDFKQAMEKGGKDD